MKRILFIHFIFLFHCLSVFPQNKQPVFDVKNLQLNWQLLENNYEGKPQFLSSLSLTNTGENIFPAFGWKIYFNYIRDISPLSVTGHVKMEHVNGDVFCMLPAKGFTELQPKESLLIDFVSGDPALNRSDAPSGWYLVWDSHPETGTSISNYSIAAIKDTAIGFITPENIYVQNKNIMDFPETQLPKIFPTPVEYKELPGEFELNREAKIYSDSFFVQEAEYLASELSKPLGKRPMISSDSASGQNIVFKQVAGAPESYQFSVSKKGILISASTSEGIFYGIQSLKCLIPASAWASPLNSIKIPFMSVSDYPRFGFRSLMLDVARNFQSKGEIMKTLDLMALCKLNNLHLHFIDDEGWRIEIPSLPELTQLGGRRGHTLDSKKFLPASFEGGPDPEHSFGSGFYTKAEFVEILKYAADRHIQVIPEIETPGHSRAAIKAMDARYERFMKQGNREEAERYLLRDINDQSKYMGAQLWTDNVICVALPSTYRFLEKVVDELLSMYKEAGARLTTIHFGGDEVPAGVWEGSPLCQELIRKDSNLHSADDLWYYYFEKLAQIVKSRGIYLSGWEEAGLRKTILDGQKQMIPNPGFVNNNFHLHVWNNMIGWGNEDLPYRLANAGYKVILSCVSNQYFDLSYSKTFEEPGYYWGGFLDIDKPFYFIPFDYYKNSKEDRKGNPVPQSYFQGKDRLTDYGKSNILGIQGLLWGENIHGAERLEYMLLPKLLGMAERAWARDPEWAMEKDEVKSARLYDQAWSLFVNTVGKHELVMLDYYDGGFSYRIPTAGAVIEKGKVIANVQLPGLIIRYTSDGKEPTVNSSIYTGPINEKGLIKLKVFNGLARSGRTTDITNN